MPYRRSCAACALAAALLLSGCSAVTGSDVESLLRAPQASGETSAVQKALNSALGVTATLKYPASGDFLSPLLFGDWVPGYSGTDRGKRLAGDADGRRAFQRGGKREHCPSAG